MEKSTYEPRLDPNTEENMQKKQKKQKKASFMNNPMICKLSRIEEKASSQEDSATYGGVAIKTLFFLVLTGIGVAAYLLNPFNIQSNMVVFFVVLGITILAPIICWFAKSLSPILGALYSLGQGFSIAASSALYAGEYTNIVYYAVAITFLLIVVMLVLYGTGIIKVGKKFRTVVSTLFFVSFFGGLAVFASAFIFPNNPLVALVYSSDGPLAIIGALIGVIIATLFLAVDFDNIKRMVTEKLPKKYEWLAAFGLIITVIWLYLKVLSLLARSQSSSN